MIYNIIADGFEGQELKVELFFRSEPKLFMNDKPAQIGNSRYEMILQRNDGKQVSATWKPQVMNWDVPKLVIDGKVVNWINPLKWYELLWCSLSFILGFIIIFGFITGIPGFPYNVKIFRTQPNSFLKYFFTGIISVTMGLIIPMIIFALIFTYYPGLFGG